MIEDEELRALFATECEEHLQSLDEGLLRLEALPEGPGPGGPGEAATLEEVFRAAHSLKGTARMLGVGGVEALAHHMEDELSRARKGRARLDSPSIDRLCFGVDTIRRLVDEAVSGAPAHVDVPRALSQLAGVAPLSSSPGAAPIAETTEEEKAEEKEEAREEAPKYLQPDATPAIEALEVVEHAAIPMPPASLSAPEPPLAPEAAPPEAEPLEPRAEPSPEPLISQLTVDPPAPQAAPTAAPTAAVIVAQEPASAIVAAEPREEALALAGEAGGAELATEFKIQTMRVPPARLDALMTLASELSVTTTRVARGLDAFDELRAMAEEWSRDIAEMRRGLGSRLGSGAESEAASKAAAFQERDQARLARLEATLERLRQTTQEDMARLSFVSGEMEEGIRRVRLLPFSSIFSLFARPVRDLAREQEKEVQLVLEGGETAADKRILEELKDPLLHMIRNSIDHGIEPPHERLRAGKPRLATLRLRARQTASNVWVELHDDGRGLSAESIQRAAHKKGLHTRQELEAMPPEQVHALIFEPGLSTSEIITDVSGRGVGMDVVRTNVEKLKGTIQVRSEPGRGTSFLICLPTTLATTRALLVSVAGRAYAIPIEFVHSMMTVEREQVFTIEGRQSILFQDKALALARLADLLELAPEPARSQNSQSSGKVTCVVLEVGEEKAGLVVDALVDEQEVMVKPLGAMLKRVRNISGATILGAGEVCLILNPHDLLRSMHRSMHGTHAGARHIANAPAAPEAEERRKLVLLAEDSLATRTLEKRILEAAGYEVVTAVDGADALGKLGAHPFDAVVSDVEMPNLNGLALAEKIRADARYNELPIILVTSLASEGDRRRGAEAGANAYIAKGSFEQKALLDALARLV